MKRRSLLKPMVGILAAVLVTAGQAATFYSSTVLNDKPIVYWNFDEADGNAIQQAPLAARPVTTENDLVPVANATRVSHTTIGSGLGKLGNAAQFSGANFFRASALRAGKTTLSGAYAVEFWLQVQGENTSDRADYIMNIGNNGPAMIYDFKPDQLEMFAGSRTDGGPLVSDSTWHHVLFVYYGDAFDGVEDRVDAYLDGIASQYIGNLYSKRMDLSQILVGAALADGANGLEGRVDEVAIYDLSSLPDSAAVTAKISSMVTKHINTAKGGTDVYATTVKADQPLLYWTFDETDGNALQQMPITLPPLDNTLNELSPQYSAIRVSHAAANSGLQLGSAIDLNGQGDFFGKTGGLDVGVKSIPGPWAVEFWFQLKGDQSARYFLNTGSAAVNFNSPAIIYGYFGTTIEVYGAGAGRSGTKGLPLNDRNWHHLLVVNHNTAPGTTSPGDVVNRVDFYVDNVLYQNVGGGFNKPIDLAGQVFFGSAVASPDPASSGSVNARLDELAFYDLSEYATSEALTAKASAMAASHYAAGFGGSSVGTITITTQPTNVTAQVGGSANFMAAATVTGTTSPLVYQWQRNEVNIEGATDATYSIPMVTINDIGTNQFRVRVSAGPAFKFSDAATLRVAMPPQPPATFYSNQVLQDKPTFYWNFDEFLGNALQLAPIALVPVTTENDLVPTGTANLRVKHVDIGSGLNNLGQAVSLDGTSFLRAADTRLAKSVVTNAYVVETWVRLDGGENQYIANFGPVGGDNTPALIYNFTKPGYLELFGSGGRVETKAIQVTDNQWHHLVWVVYNNAPAGSTNRVDIYWDGVLKENVGNGFSRNLNLRGIIVGAALGGGENAVTGAIDEFAAYDLGGLAPDQVGAKAAAIATNHYAAGKSVASINYTQLVLSDNPIVYYNFEESEGNAIQRAPVTLQPLNNAANTLVNAGARRVQHSAASTGLNLGNAADFNGVSYFRAAAPEAPKSALKAPWAVEYWFQVQGENSDNRQDYFLNFNNSPAFIYDYNPDELEIYAGVRTAGGPVVSDQQWHHVMWVFYGDGAVGVADRADAYLDGVLIQSIRNTYTGTLGLNGGIMVGAAQPGYNGFQGRMDELALYDLSGLADEAAVTAKVSAMVSSHLAAAKMSIPSVAWTRNGSQLTISWSGTGFYLQQNGSLANSAGWTDVSNGGTSPVNVAIEPAGNRFYRLIKR